MVNDNMEILNKLNEIQIDIEFIKEHMVDVDTILTLEEGKLLDESIKEFEEGKTTSLEEFKKEKAKNVQNRVS